MKVARKGWNGKKQYIQLATGISYKTADGDIVNCEHDAIRKHGYRICRNIRSTDGMARKSGRYACR